VGTFGQATDLTEGDNVGGQADAEEPKAAFHGLNHSDTEDGCDYQVSNYRQKKFHRDQEY
jgi:hypothetical protein